MVIMFISMSLRVSGYSNYAQEIIRNNEKARQEGNDAAKILGAELICGNFGNSKA